MVASVNARAVETAATMAKSVVAEKRLRHRGSDPRLYAAAQEVAGRLNSHAAIPTATCESLNHSRTNREMEATMTTLTSSEFYDRLADLFDVMTDWRSRLAFELPFLQQTLNDHAASSVLDVACGTGWHAIALAQAGWRAAGADVSPAMIARAREHAVHAGVSVPFVVSDFEHLEQAVPELFDAVLCLGNSLPHLLSLAALQQAVRQMRQRLRPGSVLIVHNLNYDQRLKTQPRFFAANGSADSLVWRFADYGAEFITFHTALFERHDAAWSVRVNSTLQRPLLAADLDEAVCNAGFVNLRHFGALDGSPFDLEHSADLVLMAEVPGEPD